MNESLIRWSKDDKQNLRKAVTNFNRKISRLEKLGKQNLPEKVNYKELIKGSDEVIDEFGNVTKYQTFPILSRRELRSTIKSLQRFGNRGSEELVELPSGEKITKWEKREIGYLKAKATRNINKRISEIDTSWGMGSSEIQALQTTLNTLKNISNKKGSELKRSLQVLKNNASGDRDLRKALIWKQNFYENLETLSGYEHYDLLMNELEKIKNPIKLYEFMSQSEILKDFFLWYKDKATSNTLAGFKDNQEAFDNALETLGIL